MRAIVLLLLASLPQTRSCVIVCHDGPFFASPGICPEPQNVA